MATDVILPALGMAQDTGKIVEWLKAEGETVTAGEPLVVIETDKAAVDLEAPATGILSRVSAKVGEEVPVAQVIAVILSPEEAAAAADQPAPVQGHVQGHATTPTLEDVQPQRASSVPIPVNSAPSEVLHANGRR